MQLGFFDMENRLGRLSEMGDALERINPNIDWEIFRPIIEHALQEARGKAKGPGGRPAFDCILMLKTLFLQRLYHLSDDQTEYQINDRNKTIKEGGVPEEWQTEEMCHKLAQKDTDAR